MNEQTQENTQQIDHTDKYLPLKEKLEKMKYEQVKSVTEDKVVVLIHEATNRYKKRITQLKAKVDNLEEGKENIDESENTNHENEKGNEENTNNKKMYEEDMAKLFVDLPKTPNVQLVFRKQQVPEQ